MQLECCFKLTHLLNLLLSGITIEVHKAWPRVDDQWFLQLYSPDLSKLAAAKIYLNVLDAQRQHCTGVQCADVSYRRHPGVVFTARCCYTERGYATVSRLSVRLFVCLSVSDVQVCFSHRLEYLKQFHSRVHIDPNMGGLVPREHPQSRVE